MYSEIQTLYRDIRRAEREMQGHRNQNNRRAAPTAQMLAEEIWAALDAPPQWQRPQELLPPDEATQTFQIEPGKAKLVSGLFPGVQIGPTFHETGDLARARYLEAHAKGQLWGAIEVPLHPGAAQSALDQWNAMVAQTQTEFEQLARAHR